MSTLGDFLQCRRLVFDTKQKTNENHKNYFVLIVIGNSSLAAIFFRIIFLLLNNQRAATRMASNKIFSYFDNNFTFNFYWQFDIL
jgi:hypothetical protein